MKITNFDAMFQGIAILFFYVLSYIILNGDLPQTLIYSILFTTVLLALEVYFIYIEDKEKEKKKIRKSLILT